MDKGSEKAAARLKDSMSQKIARKFPRVKGKAKRRFLFNCQTTTLSNASFAVFFLSLSLLDEQK
jgi:hypothetical protein